MARVDIVSGDRLHSIGPRGRSSGPYDILIHDLAYIADVVVYRLADRRGIYGDELAPIILHLRSREADTISYPILLSPKMIHDYDPEKLIGLDAEFVLDMMYGGAHNRLQMDFVCAEPDMHTWLSLDPANAALRMSVAEVLKSYIAIRQSRIGLRSTASVTNVSILKPKDGRMRLSDGVRESMQTTSILTIGARMLSSFEGVIGEYDPIAVWQLDDCALRSMMRVSVPDVYLVSAFSDEYFTTRLGVASFGMSSKIYVPLQRMEPTLGVRLSSEPVSYVQMILRRKYGLQEYDGMHLGLLDDCTVYEMYDKAEHDNMLRFHSAHADARIISHMDPEQIVTPVDTHVELDMSNKSCLGVSASLGVGTIIGGVSASYGFSTYDARRLTDLDSILLSELGRSW